VEDACAEAGLRWMHTPELGYLATDPANLGTGMRSSVMMRLPLLRRQPEFAQVRRPLRPASWSFDRDSPMWRES
jgi:protein-arginine kinase